MLVPVHYRVNIDCLSCVMFILRFLPRSLCHLVTRPARAVRVTHLKLLVWLIILFVVNRLKIKRWWFLRKVPVQFNLNFKVKRNNNKGFELEIFSSVEDGKVVWDSLLLPWVPETREQSNKRSGTRLKTESETGDTRPTGVWYSRASPA